MKKKIMIMNNALYNGGAEKVMQTLVNNLNPDIYDITLYSLIEENIDKTIYTCSLTYRYIYDVIKWNDSKFVKTLKKLKNKFKTTVYRVCSPKVFYKLFIKGLYDTEIAFVEGESTRIISGSTNKDSKKIAWVHVDLERYHWTKVAFNSFKEEINCYKKYNEIICVSDSVSECFKRFYGVNQNVITRYNPIDRNSIITSCQKHVDEKVYNRPLLVSVGRLVNQKGFDLLLEVVRRLRDEGYKLTLWILGEGEQRELLEQFIHDNDLYDTVKLLGFYENPYPYVNMADLFVVSSRSEGFSTAATEAIILGKPVITTNCSGMSELLGNNEYGIIIKNDLNSIYLELKRVLSNPDLISHYALKAKERSYHFDISKIMENIEEIL